MKTKLYLAGAAAMASTALIINVSGKDVVVDHHVKLDLPTIEEALAAPPEPKENGDIIFAVHDEGEVVRIKPNGDFIIKGRKVENDMMVFKAFKHMATRHIEYVTDKALNE